MYRQNSTSDQPVPVLITSLFGTDPTAYAVTFTVLARGSAAPAQGAVSDAATWTTDSQGQHWALCGCGPTSAYVPTAGTTMDLYVKIATTPAVVLGPVSVQFL